MAAPVTQNALVKSKAFHPRKFLFHFANEHTDFQIPELKSIAALLSIKIQIDEDKYNPKDPFLVLELPTVDQAKSLMKRTVLVRSLYELWGHGTTKRELYDSLRKFPQQLSKPYLGNESTFKITVDTFNKKITQKDKIARIEDIPADAVAFQGKVNLKCPDHIFSLLEYYGPEGSPTPDDPFELYFGRWICNGQREIINEYHLQKRHFIGNTSMDACLSLIMANMAKVRENSFVLDPFVGTGSLLVASAHFGGYVMGTELDFLLLHAKGKPSRHNQTKRSSDESIRANLAQYGMDKCYIDAIVADASKHDMWRHLGLFDAIITDPPYGIREPAKRIVNNDMEITEEVKPNHIPQRAQYNLSDIFKDLLNFAAKFLRLNGRLVFWFPVIRTEYSESNVPQHPCLRLVANSQQCLTSRVGRRLITMEKVLEYEVVECESGATYDVDHFSEASFRDRYFRKPTDGSSHLNAKDSSEHTNSSDT